MASYQITFVEKYATGSALIAASLVNGYQRPQLQATAMTLHSIDSQPLSTLTLAKNLIPAIPMPAYSLLASSNVAVLEKTDVLIGLCFEQASNDGLVAMVQKLGIEQRVPLVVYWDLAHLGGENAERFVNGVFEELQQRVRLLVGT